MLIRKGFRFQLKTNPESENAMGRFAGSCRFVWNKALALQKERLDAGEYCVRYKTLCEYLKAWKETEDLQWLYETHSQPLQQSLKDLDRAIQDAFSKTTPKRFPRFKKKGQHDSFRYPQDFKFNGSRVFLPKIGWMQFRKSRDIEGIPKNVTVSKRGKHWFISVQCEIEISEPTHPSTSIVGIDMGVRRFATLSDGSCFEPLNSFRTFEKKLAKEQRKLSRKVKFSSNWKKQKARVSRLHIRIADARNDYLHKISTTLSKNHAVVVLEDLRVSNMSKSAKGNMEEPGCNVAAKSGLNKSILDQGWYGFRLMLEYKQTWRGGRVLAVNPRNTSRTCPQCGHIAKENRKNERFRCVACGHAAHADHVGALNILAAGQAASACGAGRAQAPAMNQEPAGRAA
jgi:putative transposase